MINFKKGPALSLHQVNYIGKAKAGEAVEAGMVVRLNGDGEVVKGSTASTSKTDLLGFAINDQTDGDVIESGKIGVFALDGASVIETDKAAAAINSTNYPVGTQLTAVASTGNVAVANGTTDRVIGQVEGIREIPGVVQVINGVKVQGVATLLGIKLAS
jgi:hypothetical protein